MIFLLIFCLIDCSPLRSLNFAFCSGKSLRHKASSVRLAQFSLHTQCIEVKLTSCESHELICDRT